MKTDGQFVHESRSAWRGFNVWSYAYLCRKMQGRGQVDIQGIRGVIRLSASVPSNAQDGPSLPAA